MNQYWMHDWPAIGKRAVLTSLFINAPHSILHIMGENSQMELKSSVYNHYYTRLAIDFGAEWIDPLTAGELTYTYMFKHSSLVGVLVF